MFYLCYSCSYLHANLSSYVNVGGACSPVHDPSSPSFSITCHGWQFAEGTSSRFAQLIGLSRLYRIILLCLILNITFYNLNKLGRSTIVYIVLYSSIYYIYIYIYIYLLNQFNYIYIYIYIFRKQITLK